MMHITRTCLTAALLGSIASAQTCLLTEDGPVPGVPGVTIDSLNNTAVNQLGGYAATANCSDGLSRVIGNVGGGAPMVLRTEATIGDLEQTSFESFFGIDNAGVISYSPSSNNTVTLETGLDGVWLDDVPVALEGEIVASLPGSVWRFGSRPAVTANGIPYWVGGLDGAVGGGDQGRGFFQGLGATPLYRAGDLLPGAPAMLSLSAVDFDSRVSASGTHNLAILDVDVASSEDAYVAMDGELLEIGGLLVRESGELPASAGGLPGETWANFDFVNITDSGEYMITGDSGGDIATDEFILKNGVIVYREGDVVDGATLTGAIEGAYMNETGNIAYVWDIEDGMGGDIEALFINDTLMLTEGSMVDLDGDGTLDPGATISGFTGIGSLTHGADRRVYFTADVDTMGTTSTSDDVECVLSMKDSEAGDFVGSPATVSIGSGGTHTMFLCAPEAFGGEVYWVLGSASGTAPGLPITGVTLPLNADFYLSLSIAKPNVAPFLNTFGSLDAEGGAVAQFSLAPSGATAPIGLTLNHAYVVIDIATSTANYASAPIAVEIAP